ncbi:MAG: VWA domain-containing protein [Bacteroidales bacterium]
MSDLFFEYPKLLYLEFILVPLIVFYVYKQFKFNNAALYVFNVTPFNGHADWYKNIIKHLGFVLRIIVIACLIIAIARPRSSSMQEKRDTEGIDIVLAMDVSTSMLAQDFNPDRITAAKNIGIKFVSQRPSDRIGLVVFAGESYTQCPLTTDRPTLINLMKDLECGLINDGTAIGNGLATAVARLKDSDAKSRVIILLTDGMNNSGEIAPAMAIEIAKTYGIKVYTIGVGAEGEAPYPVQTPWGIQTQKMRVQIDEDLLEKIANETGGKYFRATDNTKLIEIYSEINKMETTKTTVESFPVYKEQFMKFAWIALIVFLLELLLRLFRIRRIV